MRVVAYVINDVTRDSRVLREAASLAAAGHDVTIMGARTRDEPPEREERDGFTIIRVPVPRSHGLRQLIRAPWRSVQTRGQGAVAALKNRPPKPGEAIRLGVEAVVILPWALLRMAWYAVVNRLLGRPVIVGGLDYLRMWRVDLLGWGRNALAAAPAADVHHAHDFEALPTAFKAAKRDGARVVYDSHEIFGTWGVALAQPGWLRALFLRWERRLARRAVGMVTVNRPIADVLRARLGVRNIIVVHNAPARWTPPAVPPDHLRKAAEIPADEPIVLCHGGFQPKRGLEETALAMLEPGLERAHLVFLGFRLPVIWPILHDPRLEGRVHYVPGVDPSEVLEWVSGADVDVMAILPADQNSIMSTPNKLFESIAAGVPVVSSDFPERRRIVLDDPDGPLGALCDPSSPQSIAAAIRSILDLPPAERDDLRARCLKAAHERWNWETESARLVALYAKIAAR
jgi:glycosyltransferase involved in cell wall biosynthesis